jgi:serine/threonine-protein kinase
MGTTFRAYDLRLRKSVALKIINEHTLSEPSARRRFFHEARAAALIDHPHVARVLYLCPENAPECFFAMELVEGESLAQRVSRHGPIEPAEALRLLRPLADVLGVLEEHGLVHRDIKPENIMIASGPDAAGRVKLIDFGIAKSLKAEPELFESVHTGERFIGSIYYASPEQIRPRMTVDSRSDFYSLGATLWYALTGAPPFTGTVSEVQESHVYTSPAWEKVAGWPGVEKLLRSLLAKESGQRPRDAAALLTVWDEALAGIEKSESQVAQPAGGRPRVLSPPGLKFPEPEPFPQRSLEAPDNPQPSALNFPPATRPPHPFRVRRRVARLSDR